MSANETILEAAKLLHEEQFRYLFLSRKQHDALLANDPDALRDLCQFYSHKWSLAGVVFYGVPLSMHSRITKAQ